MQLHNQHLPYYNIILFGARCGGCANGCFPLFSKNNLDVLKRRHCYVLMHLMNCVQIQRKPTSFEISTAAPIHLLLHDDSNCTPSRLLLLESLGILEKLVKTMWNGFWEWNQQTSFFFSFALNIKLEYITLHSPYEKHFKRYGSNYLLKLIPHINIELGEPFS